MTHDQWCGVVAAVRERWRPARVNYTGWRDYETYWNDPAYMLDQLDAARFHAAITRLVGQQSTDGWPPRPAALIDPILADWQRRNNTQPVTAPEPVTRGRDPLDIIAAEIGDTPFGRAYLEKRGHVVA